MSRTFDNPLTNGNLGERVKSYLKKLSGVVESVGWKLSLLLWGLPYNYCGETEYNSLHLKICWVVVSIGWKLLLLLRELSKLQIQRAAYWLVSMAWFIQQRDTKPSRSTGIRELNYLWEQWKPTLVSWIF